jgi:MYXO-CTERM domain-containing protein
VNVADEQIKWHGLGTGSGPTGVIVIHNTFVTPGHAIQTSTSATSHYMILRNNLWVGTPTDGRTIEWDAPIDHGDLDYDGFAPDGTMHFLGTANYASFAEMVAAGVFEPHGVLVSGTIFASLTPPTDYHTALPAPDAALATGSMAIDHGSPLVGLSYDGAAPDLGAIESGCAVPIYGIRPAGTDETNEPRGCGSAIVPGDDAGTIGLDSGTPGVDAGSIGIDASRADGGATPAASAGCGCRAGGASSARGLAWLGLVLFALRRRRHGLRETDRRS